MNTAHIHLRDADEIEAFFLETTGMKPGYCQLSAGPSGIEMTVCELEGVSLIWTRGEGRIRWLDQMVGNGVHLGFMVESEGPVLSHGREIGRSDAQVWMQEAEMDVVINGPYLSLDIGVSEELSQSLGWELGGVPTQAVQDSALRRLIQTCLVATDENSPQSFLEQRDAILDRIEPVLQPWRQPLKESNLPAKLAPATYRLLRSADQWLDRMDPAQHWAVDELADELGVSRRTLFHAFRSSLGVGPRRFFEIHRLNHLRRRIKQARRTGETITQLAGDLGFSDMGRMAARYREQFGENPSQTLKNATH